MQQALARRAAHSVAAHHGGGTLGRALGRRVLHGAVDEVLAGDQLGPAVHHRRNGARNRVVYQLTSGRGGDDVLTVVRRCVLGFCRRDGLRRLAPKGIHERHD